MRWFEIVAQMSEKNKAYVIVTVLEVKGSSPREEGTKMIVSGDKSYHDQKKNKTNTLNKIYIG